MRITAAFLRSEVLDPTMDARALNLDQFDPSPGVDSIVEQLRLVIDSMVASDARDAALELVDELIASNLAEGRHECRVNTFACTTVSELRDRELNQSSAADPPLSSKDIARWLQAPLDLLLRADHAPQQSAGRPSESARRLVALLLSRTSSRVLLGQTVRYELGVAKADRLAELVREIKSAGAVTTSGARDQGGTPDHAEH